MENRNHKHHHNLSLKMEKYPRDLLQRLVMPSGSSDDNTQTHHHRQNQQQEQQQEQEEEHEEEEEVELNLGLSLGGRFGVDKHAKNKKLMRSSSVVGTMTLLREGEGAAPPSPMATLHPVLMRTSSLPTETEEEWRKRKELQTLRRMEAKRRRSEKQRLSKTEKEGSAGAGAAGGGGLEEVEGASAATMGLNRFGGSSMVAPPSFGLPSWAVGARQVVLGDVLGKGKVSGAGFQGLFAQLSSQGSADSQGGSSSSMSEMESKPFLGYLYGSLVLKFLWIM